MIKIIENSAVCNKCGEKIISTHVHDFVWCKCQAIAVDGGTEYLKRCGNPEDYKDTSITKDDYRAALDDLKLRFQKQKK